MSDQHFTNNFYVHGDNNTVNFSQSITTGSDGNEALQMVLKFLLTLLLSPIMLPFLMAANGMKMLKGDQGGDYDA